MNNAIYTPLTLKNLALLFLWLSIFSFLPKLAESQEIQCGELIQADLSLGQSRIHTFQADEGDIISALVTNASGGRFNPDAQIFQAGNPNPISSISSRGNLRITQSGAYSIRVYERESDDSGTYNLQVQWLLPEENSCSSPITCGEFVTQDLEAATQHTYTFQASEGDTISALITNASGVGFNPEMQIYQRDNPSPFVNISSRRNFRIPRTDTYSIVVYDHGFDHSGSYNMEFTWLLPEENSCSSSISCGQFVTQELELSRQHTYTFEADEGDTISALITNASGGSFNPDMQIYQSGNPNPLSSIASRGNFRVPQTGTYSILVYERELNDSGTYNLQLKWLLPEESACSTPITCGEFLTRQLDRATQHTYTFEATEGDTISALITNASGGGFNPEMQIYQRGNPSPFVNISSRRNFRIPQTDTYSILVYDHSFDHSGSYNLEFKWLLPEENACSSSIKCGELITKDLGLSSQHTYTFEANEGDTISALITNASGGSFNPDMQIYQIGNANPLSSIASRGNFRIPQTGTYTILVYERELNDSGTYNLQLKWLLPEESACSTPISCGELTTERLEVATQHTYTFEAKEGDTISALITSLSGGGFNPEMQVYQRGNPGPLVNISSRRNFRVPQTDTYSILVYDRAFAHSGTYNLQFQWLLPEENACSTPISCGELVNGELELGTQNTYTFRAEAGDTISAQIENTSGGTFNPDMQVYRLGHANPISSISSIANILIQETGTYSILVYERELDQAGSYKLQYQWINKMCDCNGNGVADETDISNGTSRDLNENNLPDECDGNSTVDKPEFIRGDANDDSLFDISDALTILGYLFLGSPSSLQCEKAADVDDSGSLDITDAVHVARYLFRGEAPPPAPFDECGVDPTQDPLTCQSFSRCN